jgi:hypothetical protein
VAVEVGHDVWPDPSVDIAVGGSFDAGIYHGVPWIQSLQVRGGVLVSNRDEGVRRHDLGMRVSKIVGRVEPALITDVAWGTGPSAILVSVEVRVLPDDGPR